MKQIIVDKLMNQNPATKVIVEKGEFTDQKIYIIKTNQLIFGRKQTERLIFTDLNFVIKFCDLFQVQAKSLKDIQNTKFSFNKAQVLAIFSEDFFLAYFDSRFSDKCDKHLF